MALRKILTDRDPVLHKTSRPVTNFDDRLHDLLDDLKETLANAGGAGLAVERPMRVKVRAQDRTGAFFEAEGAGIVARCFCHEIDHLDGHLFTELTDHLYTQKELDEMMEAEEGKKR